MKIYVQMKTVGKKKPVFTDVPYEIGNDVKTLRELLVELVKIEVEAYIKKGTDTQLTAFLSDEEIKDQAAAGKVGFGRIYSDKKPDVSKAVENAWSCFEDGLVRVFCGEQELEELDGAIEIKDGDQFTFIRLTFLAGRLW